VKSPSTNPPWIPCWITCSIHPNYSCSRNKTMETRINSYFYSRMRSKGSRFTLGVWGLRVCSLVTFGGFKRRIAAFRVASVALCDIQTCFTTWQKSFCVAGAILLRRFQKMRCSYRSRRSTLDVSIFILRGRCSTLEYFRRVLWLVFCESHCQGCVKWWQGANSIAGVAFCEMCWKLTEASHETSILKLQILRF